MTPVFEFFWDRTFCRPLERGRVYVLSHSTASIACCHGRTVLVVAFWIYRPPLWTTGGSRVFVASTRWDCFFGAVVSNEKKVLAFSSVFSARHFFFSLVLFSPLFSLVVGRPLFLFFCGFFFPSRVVYSSRFSGEPFSPIQPLRPWRREFPV